MKSPTFIALDLETADYGRDSACAHIIEALQAGI